ncbi:MAG: lipase, partial [Thermoanaerobaculia bacterium]
MKRVLFLLAVLLAGSARAQTGYIAFGDSITFGVGDDPLRTDKGYPPRLQALLQGAALSSVV